MISNTSCYYIIFISVPDLLGVSMLDIVTETLDLSFSLRSLIDFYLDHCLDFFVEYVDCSSVSTYVDREGFYIFGPYSSVNLEV